MNFFLGNFPATRLRRLRSTLSMRELIQENQLTVNDLILPLFIRESDAPGNIIELPDVRRYTVNELPEILEKAQYLGIKCIALFPYVAKELKNDDADEALNPDNLICRAIRQIKYHHPNMLIIADVALDPYTTHGHDGLLINNRIENDETISVLCRQALTLCEAGADIIAPSDMMDGRIGAIRQLLDTQGYQDRLILSYSAKFASAFYGPFRNAVGVDSLKGLSDKKTYQLSPYNRKEAMREIAQDIIEGADMILIKPGLPYLDIVYQCATEFSVPLFVYQVSGEYALYKSYPNPEVASNMLFESLISFKRAGAQAIFTYAAFEIAEKLKDNL
jgi:porphobilinogen synthase